MQRHLRPGSAPLLGTLIGVAIAAAVCAALFPFRGDMSAAGPALALVVPVVVAGLVGGGRAAVVLAVASALAFNVVFLRPYWTLKVDAVEDGIALAVFLLVAIVMGALVALEADRRRDAEQRAEEQAALVQELGRVSAERERLADEAARLAVLESIDEQRAALLRSVSHDLRTPLATIRAIATDLREGPAYDEGTEQELLATVCDEAERLDRLVANLLSMSRIEAGAFHPDRQAVDVEELVGESARRLRPLFSDTRLEVHVDHNVPLVDGDYSQLDQVVTNLLENAARHAPAGSTVRLSAHRRNGRVQLRVSDDGPGIAESEREHLFEAFRTGPGSTSSGVGLAICRAVVEAHGGAITVEHGPGGGGAVFLVELPTRRA